MSDAPTQVPTRVWLSGLRRAWAGGALSRWVADRGVTGAVYTPAAYEIEDVADAVASLVAAGARPDASLLWDLVVSDVREAADALRGPFAASEGEDGYVAVWLDPARAADPGRAAAAARELYVEARRANVAVALTWTPARAGVVEKLVADGAAVALSGVRDEAARTAVGEAAARGRAALEADEESPKPPRPVFVLDGADGGGLLGVRLTTEFAVFGAPSAPPPRLPLSPDAEQAGLKAAADRLTARAALPARDDSYTPSSFAAIVNAECRELEGDEVLEDVWARDHTIWKDDPTEIADRLGWLDAPERFASEMGELAEWGRKTRASTGASRVVVCGMGGSVFACEMFDSVLGGDIPLTVLDTTDPEQIAAVTASLDLGKTLFVISSKSGTTAETRSHLEYFWPLVGSPERFVAVTDPGTELESLATERGFARVFVNPPEIGGRFSGLSYFGLVPAALAGIDVEAIVSGARRAMTHNAPGVRETRSSGVRLGAALGAALLRESRDKLTFVLPDRLASFGVWVEQLLAESLGKEGKGILPVLDEPLLSADEYGADRVLVVYTLGDEPPPPQLEALEADLPIIRLRVADTRQLGAEMYRWEIATAIVGYLLDINPFDQPDVEAAKRRAREALARPPGERPDAGSVGEVLSGVREPAYIALMAFVPPTDANAAKLQAARARLRERYRVPVTLGYGPRFLHSTGQLHKGGPGRGAFVQVTAPHASDLEVPGTGYTFGRLIDAQADGDLEALRDVDRRVARIGIDAVETLGVEE